MSTFKGANLVERLGNATWSLAEGWKTSKVYEGSHAAIEAFLPTVRNLLHAESITIERGDNNNSILTAYFGKNENEPVEAGIATWELLSNDLTKDNYEHPKALEFHDAVLTAVKQAVTMFEDQTKESPVTMAECYAHINTACISTGYPANNPIRLFDLRIRGAETYVINQFVLRKVHYVSNNWEQKIPFSGIEYLWTAQQIDDAEFAIYGFGIPPGIAFDINMIPAPPTHDDYFWSWLKKGPNAVVASQNKIQLTQEWWLEQWSLFDYNKYDPLP